MTCRAYIQLPLKLGGLEARIDTQMTKILPGLLVHLAGLDNGINPDIGTIKKDRGSIFS